jgi:hypothetical protein
MHDDVLTGPHDLARVGAEHAIRPRLAGADEPFHGGTCETDLIAEKVGEATPRVFVAHLGRAGSHRSPQQRWAAHRPRVTAP